MSRIDYSQQEPSKLIATVSASAIANDFGKHEITDSERLV